MKEIEVGLRIDPATGLGFFGIDETLPSGYAISYQSELITIDEEYDKNKELTEEKKQAREWYNNIRNWCIQVRY